MESWKTSLTNLYCHLYRLLYAAIQLGPTALAFWIVESFPLTMGIFALNQMAQYPLNIYPKIIQILLILFSLRLYRLLPSSLLPRLVYVGTGVASGGSGPIYHQL